MPPEDGAETESAAFDNRENDSNSSPSKAPQLLPLALTTGSKSLVDALNSGSTFKKSTTNDATSVKMEESEGSTPSVSPPLTRNPPSVGAEDPLRLGDNAPADGSPVNPSTYSEEETHTDLGSTSPFKAPLASSHSAAENGDSEADDTPLSLCVSKPAVENDKLQTGVNNDETCSTDEPTTSPSSNPQPPAANPVPELTPPVSPKVEAEEASGSVPNESQENSASHGKGKRETATPRKSLQVLDSEMEKDTKMEEGYNAPEKPSQDAEPSTAAPATHTQPPRPDKPYSCSQCGKAYASRSGLKVRIRED